MDIGTEKPAITVVPVHDPFEKPLTLPAEWDEPAREPVEVPVRERELEEVGA